MNEKIAVIGAGSWGTTLAVLLAKKGYSVSMWAREKKIVDEINNNHTNLNYLKDIIIPSNVTAFESIKEASGDADLIINSVPSQFTREVSKTYSNFVKENSIIVNVSKGIELGSFKTMSQVLSEEFPDSFIVTLSGPNHAEEVSREIPTATVVASENSEILDKVVEIFQTDVFKAYPLSDIIGVDICGAIKNITAIATGVCDGLGFGDNARGSIITLGLMEMSHFGSLYGANRKTFYGIAGIGDLVATCTSKHSRNRFVGEKLAEGKHFEEIKKEMHGMVAEGVKTVKAVYEYAKKNNLEMPITNQAYKVLYEAKDIKKAVKDLVRLI